MQSWVGVGGDTARVQGMGCRALKYLSRWRSADRPSDEEQGCLFATPKKLRYQPIYDIISL